MNKKEMATPRDAYGETLVELGGKYRDIVVLDAKAIDVRTKEQVGAGQTKGRGIESIMDQIGDLSKQIARSIGLSPRKVDAIPQNVRDVTTTSLEAYRYYQKG